jgi:hypothetical protein
MPKNEQGESKAVFDLRSLESLEKCNHATMIIHYFIKFTYPSVCAIYGIPTIFYPSFWVMQLFFFSASSFISKPDCYNIKLQLVRQDYSDLLLLLFVVNVFWHIYLFFGHIMIKMTSSLVIWVRRKY